MSGSNPSAAASSNAPSAKFPNSFPDMIKQIENKISSLGPGPHLDKQRDELMNLQTLLAKVKQEHAKTMIGKDSVPQSTPVTMATGGHDPATMVTVSEKVLDHKRLTELLHEVDPMEQLEDDAEETLLQMADDFIEEVLNGSADLAKFRNGDTVEAKDTQFYLERVFRMSIPGFTSEELRPYKKAMPTEAHRQHLHDPECSATFDSDVQEKPLETTISLSQKELAPLNHETAAPIGWIFKLTN